MLNKKDYIDQLHDKGVYLPGRFINLTGEINEEKTEEVLNNLYVLDKTDGIITILLNSEGGDVYNGFAIYDSIIACRNHIKIIATGNCQSMATLLFQAGDERVLTSNCTFMMHIGEEALPSNHPKINRAWQKYNDKIEENMIVIYMDQIKKKKPRYRKSDLKKMIDFDIILNPDEVINLGLADRIGSINEER